MDSNQKFLTILIIMAIAISVLGTFFSLNMLGELEAYREYFTGHSSSGSGQVNLTISQNLTINVIQTVINFSVGFVSTGQDGTTLNTTVPEFAVPPANWTNSSIYNPKPIEIRNNGNVNCSLNLTSGKTAAQFIGGTAPSYEFNGSNKEPNSCPDLLDYTTLTGVTTQFCTNLGTSDGKDEVYVHCRLWVPYDTVGTKEDIWTFNAVANITG